MKNETKARYCFLDTETTGLSTVAEVVEIALILTDKKFVELDRYHFYSLPSIQTDSEEMKEAFNYNGLTLNYLINKRYGQSNTQAENWEYILKIMKTCDLLICQNPTYDMRLIWQTIPHLFDARMPRCEDLASFAAPFMLFEGYQRHNSLRAICEACGIVNEQAHSAMSDTKALLECFKYIDEYYWKHLR